MISVSQLTGCLPLENGDCLDQPEFHERYLTYPEGIKIELVGGVVYIMASPLSINHSQYDGEIGYWLETYSRATTGVEALHGASVLLGLKSEPQPDLGLRILPEYGGQSGEKEEEVKGRRLRFVTGAAELLVEIAVSTRAMDLNQQKRDYRFSGVKEYLVVCSEEEELFWFNFAGRGKLRPDKAGVYRSRAFPGLWLDGPALLARQSGRVADALRLGLASPDHAAFAARLRAAKM